ncbi:MAG: VWA domain-containing protein [Phycisphaerae bacterium]|nr:VWA domain-containing protein [Phycisphaerae bacterium]
MSLLSWPVALAFAGISVPLLLLLYFLKLRRQERKVSSTLLWKRAVHDLQVNAPFQRLRKNLLLFLQLLILAAVLFAIANPVANFMRRPEENLVLLVDRSGSMKTIEADGRTRLDHAKDAAMERVSNLPNDARAMVISFADRANVVCSFTDNESRLKQLIEQIEPTDAVSRIGEALQLAVAYSTQFIEETGVGVPQTALQGDADIELFSDGRIADVDEEYVTRGEMRYYRIGAADDNVGIVAFGVRRDYERPGMLSAFAQVENFGPRPVTLDLSLLVNGNRLPGAGSVQEVTLGPATALTTRPSDPALPTKAAGQPSSQKVVFEFLHEAGGIIEVRLHREDALMIDNSATAPIDPPRQVRTLVVSDRERVAALLLRGLTSIGVEDIVSISGADYENAADGDLIIEGRSAFDLVILDNHETGRLPPGNYLFFGGLPAIEGVARGDEIAREPLVMWQENHPLIRNVPFENVYVAQWAGLTLPGHAQALVEGEDSTVVALITDPGHNYIIFAFDLLDSDFLWEPAYLMFLQNTVMFFAGSGLMDTRHLVSPGETLTIQVPPGAQTLRITRPGGTIEKLDVVGRHTLTYARTHDTGIYRAAFDDPAKTKEVFAANILDSTESLIAPNANLSIGGIAHEAYAGETKVNEPLWPHLAAGALLILLVEWWVYNRRVMV